MMNYITLLDFVLLPVVLIVIYVIALYLRNKFYHPGHPYRKYFLQALNLKIAGAIAIGLIYHYYYVGGDTFAFFAHSRIINSAFEDSPTKWFNLLLHIPDETTVGYYKYISAMEWYNDPSSYTVASVAAFISFFLGNTYLPTAVIFAVISFTGSWAMFRAFAKIYPDLLKHVALAVLFIPSVLIWGSGVFKDTICLAALGWLTYTVFEMLIEKNFSPKNVMLAAIALFVTYRIKLYILMGFIPALMVWILFIYTARIKSTAVKFVISFGALLITVGGVYYIMNSLGSNYLGNYSLDKIQKTAEITRDWISFSSGDEGSTYDLGEIGSPGQLISKFPLAVNVTLFRPYLWESRKIFVFVSAVESFLFLLLTLKLIFTVGLKRIWATLSKDPTLQFCLIFSLIFAFAVGVSSYNFGALSRYKIPCLPFYGLFVLITYYKNMSDKKPILKIGKVLTI